MSHDSRLLYLLQSINEFTWPIDSELEMKGLVEIFGLSSLRTTKITEAGMRYINRLTFYDILIAYKEWQALRNGYDLVKVESFHIFAKRAMNRLTRAALCEYLVSDISWVREMAKQVYDSKSGGKLYGTN